MFECLEEVYGGNEKVLLVKEIQNKKRSKQKYLFLTSPESVPPKKLKWVKNMKEAVELIPGSVFWNELKRVIIEKNIHCHLMIMNEHELAFIKPEKEKSSWWNKIKRWFLKKKNRDL